MPAQEAGEKMNGQTWYVSSSLDLLPLTDTLPILTTALHETLWLTGLKWDLNFLYLPCRALNWRARGGVVKTEAHKLLSWDYIP